MIKRLLWIIGALIALGVLCWCFPLFHVVPIGSAQKQQQNAAFDAATFAREFWNGKFLPAAKHATEVSELLKALTREPSAARKTFGRSPGMSSVTYCFVTGSGKIVKVEKDVVRIALDGQPPDRLVELTTGLVFGNALRDASGLLNGSDFPNSQDFNNISTELNHIVETSVIPGLSQQAAPGKTLRFSGCIELEEGALPKILQIIPVEVEWQ